MHTYRCKVIKIIDGDTIDVDIDLGFGIWLRNERVRLYGIDTPESRTRDEEEKKYGKAAAAYLEKWVKSGGVTIRTHKDEKGKFGRILGEVWCFETNVNAKMIEEGHAVEYHGQSKEEISEQHIENRKRVKLE